MNANRNNKVSVEEIMGSLNDIQRVSPRPYFFTRVIARLDKTAEENIWKPARPIFARPAFVIAALCLIVAVDSLFFLRKQQEETPVAQSTDQNEQTIATEYGLASNSFSDYESYEP